MCPDSDARLSALGDMGDKTWVQLAGEPTRGELEGMAQYLVKRGIATNVTEAVNNLKRIIEAPKNAR